MSSTTRTAVPDDDRVSKSSPRAGGPSRRRTYTPTEKLAHLSAYELACETGQGGGYLRAQGLFSSQITDWRRLRDGGALTGATPASNVPKLTADQKEIARLRAKLDRSEWRLARTEVALDIMGKAHALLEDIYKSAPEPEAPKRR